jgi:hypothetical protein
MVDGTEHSTVSSAVPSFEKWLSHEDTEPVPETQPEAVVEAPEPKEVETAAEVVETEGESAETPETAEETPEGVEETPESVALDPTLKVKVKIDGVETEVTLDEALKGYSRTADYTRKTQAAAAERKAFETEQVAVRGERQKYATYLTQLEQAIQQNSAPEPDWAKLQQTATPEEFASEYARYQIHSDEMTQLKAEKDRAVAAVNADQQKALETHIAGEHEKLLAALPDWKDEKVATTERAKMVAYADKLGWTQEDLGKVTDHRNLLLLRKAMLYDESQAKKPVIQARIDKIRTATPGPAATPKPKVSDTTKARLRLANTGKVEDAAAAFFAMLDD